MTVTMTEERYASRVERVYERVLRERMIACLRKLREAFEVAGYEVSGPFDLSDDCYRWYILVEGKGLAEAVDLTVELAESLGYEGTLAGVNVGLDIVAYGGAVLGGLCPYNYTDECWASLSDLHEVSRRMQIIEEADPLGAIALVDEYAARHVPTGGGF